MRPPRSFRLQLGAVAALGVGLRALYVGLTSSASSFHVVGDPAVYKFTAEHLAAGDGYISPIHFFAGDIAPTAEHPPLFSLTLAGLIKLGANGITSQRLLVACVVGGAVVVAVGLLGRRVAGDRAGLIAAALGAGLPTLVGAGGSAESEPLYGLWLVLALIFAYRLLDRGDMLSAAGLGAAIGLGALTRNDALLLLPLLALPIAIRGGPGRWSRLAVSCVVAAGLLAPWIARNWIVFDRPVLTTNYGQGLAGSNCRPTYYGDELGFFSLSCFRLDARRSEADWSADLAHRGLSYARHHAGRAPLVMIVRVLRGTGFYEPGEQLRIYNMPQRMQDVGIALWYPLLLLAAAGLLILRRRGEPLAPLLAPILVTILVLALYSGITRYRHGAELSMVVLAAVALDELLRRVERRPVQ